MIYEPLKGTKKDEWIAWLENQAHVILTGKAEIKENNGVFETPEGDVAVGKDLVGNLLATLKGENVEIH